MVDAHEGTIAADNLPGRGRSTYLDLALIFLLYRFSLLILFFLYLALIALITSGNSQM